MIMEIDLPEILQTLHSTKALFFYRPRYNPLPLFAGILIFALIVSFISLPLVRAAGSDDLKRKACSIYFGAAIFSCLYGVIGLLYAAFVWASRYFGSNSFGKQLLWFDSLPSLTCFLLGLTVFGLLLMLIADKIMPRRSKNSDCQSGETKAETDFNSLKLNG